MGFAIQPGNILYQYYTWSYIFNSRTNLSRYIPGEIMCIIIAIKRRVEKPHQKSTYDNVPLGLNVHTIS